MKKVISLVLTLILLVLLSVSCSVTIEENNSQNVPEKINQSRELTVSFIDVGQGDSILIKTPGDKYIMVDSGSSDGKDKLYDFINKMGVDGFDVIIATHPHEDHIGNLDNIIEDYKVEEVYMPKVSTNTKAFENLLNSIKQKGLKIKNIKTGLEFNVDSVRFEFLAPNSDTYEDMNNYSGVLKVSYGETSFLLMGDAEKLSEGEILKSGADVNANVIKIGHHGSSSSSSKKFIQAVNPKYAVISCGEGNDYNHPHKETISLLNSLKVKTFRTDLSGTITFNSDGKELNYFSNK
jgi:competence protein ComEC